MSSVSNVNLFVKERWKVDGVSYAVLCIFICWQMGGSGADWRRRRRWFVVRRYQSRDGRCQQVAAIFFWRSNMSPYLIWNQMATVCVCVCVRIPTELPVKQLIFLNLATWPCWIWFDSVAGSQGWPLCDIWRPSSSNLHRDSKKSLNKSH